MLSDQLIRRLMSDLNGEWSKSFSKYQPVSSISGYE